MKVLGKGKIDVKDTVVAVTLTPVDVGTLTTAGQKLDAVVKVQTNLGTRDPKAVTGLSTTNPLVTASFVAPNIVRLTLGTPTAAVSALFDFELDAT